tara:strand:+ start:195 stop:551 length:357 start_codon:yes stop_codon:yes gene_type:complete
MKNIMIMLALVIAFILPLTAAYAQSPALRKVETQYTCMVTNAVYDRPQIAVEVNGKTYYGCCPMCKERLAKDASLRSAVDPVSGKTIDKADAVIGAASDGSVYYFESKDNLKAYKPVQ